MISSTTNINTYISFLCTFLVCICLCCCSAKNNITTGDSINDGLDYLESPGKKFQMGFFPHQRTSQRRYVGIWYTMDPETIVWVANRDKPVLDSTGVLMVAEDGDVKVLDKNQVVYFSTSIGGGSLRTLMLLDDGNAVLVNVASRIKLWQSFLHPTDTFLPGMIMDVDLNLTSWKNQDDPETGRFMFQQDQVTNEYVILNGSTVYRWKSGSVSSRNNFDQNQMFLPAYNLLSNSSVPTIKKKTYNNRTLEYPYDLFVNNLSRLLMNYTGNIQYYSWVEGEKQWALKWEEPHDTCTIDNVCGSFGLCNLSNDDMCSCLPGFESTPGDFAAGCKRTFDICHENNDKFINLTMINVENPTLPFFPTNNESECMNRCLENCHCEAYSYGTGNTGVQGCWIWNSELNNLQANGEHTISVRVPKSVKASVSRNSTERSPLDNSSSSSLTRKYLIIFGMTTLVILLLCSMIYIYYKRIVTREQERSSILQMNESERTVKDLLDLDHSREEDTEGIGVPFFELQNIMTATDNFSDANKLGQGGFGPVYKGKFPGGLEVAVKRLSSLSGQGLEEFKNEVVVIAKLQHRNLVRLLGYCMKGNEKILLYEYMPNKSLDAFIFDRAPRISLDWAKRFEIIMGIARGLLYLHQDSRLRIIHRDLKTSNILLDEEMNPKISDFGLAKIVRGKEMEASTNRVIGTYGYMAPEYALDGLFSIKSDVFSFGVVVLEIISGKKNTGFYQSQQASSLLSHAWNLWQEDMLFELMDRTLVESSNSSEVLKCIIVGLLCVQEDPGDRPTMANVVLMLGGDITSLPAPKQPAFVTRKPMPSSSSSSSYKQDQTQTNNELTISVEEGR